MTQKVAFLFGVVGLLTITSCITEEITGRASVIDGDTIEIHEQRIRLHGIDAPEAGQACSKADGASWPCGRQAALALSGFLGTQTVRCVPNGTSYDCLVAVCEIGGIDVAAWLVRKGWAIASARHSLAYADEEEARETGLNIWQGEFVDPRDWRVGARLPEYSDH